MSLYSPTLAMNNIKNKPEQADGVKRNPRQLRQAAFRKELAQRIKDAIEASHLPKAEVARRVGALVGGLVPQAVTGWEKTGTISGPTLVALARVVERPLSYFLQNAEEMAFLDVSIPREPQPAGIFSDDPKSSTRSNLVYDPARGVVKIPAPLTKIPVVPLAEIKDFLKMRVEDRALKNYRTIGAYEGAGPRAFATRVVGDAMEPCLQDGATATVDPDVEPAHGTYVLLMLDGAPAFRLLAFDGLTPYARTTNPAMPERRPVEAGSIIGVVTEWNVRAPRPIQ